VLPLWVLPTLRVGDRMRRLQLEWRDENAEMTSHLAETLSVNGTMVVKTFGRQELEAERFRRANETLRQLSIRRFMAGRWFNVATELFGAFAVVFVYWYGARGVIDGSVGDIGTVVAFAGLSQRVFGPFRSIARINTTALSTVALFQRLFEYLDLPIEVAEKPGARSLPQPQGRIELRDVSFHYRPDAGPALEDVSFSLEPGRMLALVGPSGAGKTTVTYLLQRFYDPSRGSVLLDGHDLRDLTLETVSRAIGAVMQETYLFHASLGENVRYGRVDASDREVAEAVRVAGLGELVSRLPEGLDTVVGERGFRLSGGEKQRVAIARAVLKDPRVLILDEATASLDTRLEREIQEATQRLARGRSTVVIAHRLSTVIAADEILVLDQGRVVERGTHAQLLARGGLYASLHQAQLAS
jgi:ATP-binding cassette subfamily B protein